MGFKNGGYATVFSVAKGNGGNGNFYDVNLATSKKGSDGNYATDFRGFARFIGNAAKAIAKYDGQNSRANGNHPVTRIKLGEVEVTNSYNKENDRTYTNHLVYTFEFADSKSNNASKPTTTMTANDYANNVPTGDEDSLFT